MARETQVILQCREHSGGRFTKPPGRRGRNPVRCNPEEGWGCSAAETAIEKPKRRKRSAESPVTIAERRPVEVMEDVPVRVVERPATARKLPEGAQASKKARDAATEALEGLEWVVSGKGWAENPTGIPSDEAVEFHASITANRGPETLYLEWIDGVQVASDYAILDTSAANNNGDMPATNLPFDPETVSDGELVQYISGSKIEWWNRVGGMIEKGVCGDPKSHNGIRVAIEHVYNGIAGPAGIDRLIRFNLMDGGTRVIKVGALLKVG